MDYNDFGLPREFVFTDRDFNFLRKLVLERTGISLSDSKREMIYCRLVKRIRELKLGNFKKYCELLKNDSEGKELNFFTNAVTTNLTAFFREPHHFKFLNSTVFQDLENRKKKRIRIWSAGCSSGEEPYSIGITARKYFAERINQLDFKILATDIDSSVLKTAKEGVYNSEKINALEYLIRRNWFLKGAGNQEGKARIRDEVRNIIIFKELNLMNEWPMKGSFDVIFCRNVVIYFDKPTQKILINRFADILDDKGYLFLGHSESLFQISDRFKIVDQTTYQKIA